MLKGLRKASEGKDADLVLANPILPEDILKGTYFDPISHFIHVFPHFAPTSSPMPAFPLIFLA